VKYFLYFYITAFRSVCVCSAEHGCFLYLLLLLLLLVVVVVVVVVVVLPVLVIPIRQTASEQFGSYNPRNEYICV